MDFAKASRSNINALQMKVKIAVILPVYNGGVLLKKAITSVLEQDEHDFEFLICDDCSTDDSVELIKELVKADLRVKVYQNEQNLGLFKTLNKLMHLTIAPIIHLWSQDDVMKPNCLGTTLQFHHQYPEIGMSYSGRDLIDENGDLISTYPDDETPTIINKELYAKISSYWGCMAGNIANVTLNKSAFLQVGDFNEEMKVSGDFEYWTRIADNYPIGFNKTANIFLRIHPAQLSHQYSSIAHRIKEDIAIMQMLLPMAAPKELNKIKRCWKWKSQTMFFNEIFYLLRHQQWTLAQFSLKEIAKISFIPTLAFRWLIVKFMRLLGKEIWFYKNIIHTLN